MERSARPAHHPVNQLITHEKDPEAHSGSLQAHGAAGLRLGHDHATDDRETPRTCASRLRASLRPLALNLRQGSRRCAEARSGGYRRPRPSAPLPHSGSLRPELQHVRPCGTRRARYLAVAVDPAVEIDAEEQPFHWGGRRRGLRPARDAQAAMRQSKKRRVIEAQFLQSQKMEVGAPGWRRGP